MDTCWIIFAIFVLLSLLGQVSAEIKCPRLKIANGRARIRMRGRMVFFRCRRRFTRYGLRLAACVNGQWSHPPPVCIAAGCRPLPKRDHLISTSVYSDALFRFRCEDNYKLVGPKEVYCRKPYWNDKPPFCLALKPIETCNFESEHLCGWVQDKNDTFNWRWHTGKTVSAYTGPTNDHTLANRKGHYMYIEASAPRLSGDVARLISPEYPAKLSSKCFKFWFHMYGPNAKDAVGKLSVYLKLRGSERLYPEFEIDGNQGNKWTQADISIEKIRDPFQIVFSATRRKSHASDIAIDDVGLFDCDDYTTEAYNVSDSSTDRNNSTTRIVSRSSSATKTTVQPSTTTRSRQRTSAKKTRPTASKVYSRRTTKMYTRKRMTGTPAVSTGKIQGWTTAKRKKSTVRTYTTNLSSLKRSSARVTQTKRRTTKIPTTKRRTTTTFLPSTTVHRTTSESTAVFRTKRRTTIPTPSAKTTKRKTKKTTSTTKIKRKPITTTTTNTPTTSLTTTTKHSRTTNQLTVKTKTPIIFKTTTRTYSTTKKMPTTKYKTTTVTTLRPKTHTYKKRPTSTPKTTPISTSTSAYFLSSVNPTTEIHSGTSLKSTNHYIETQTGVKTTTNMSGSTVTQKHPSVKEIKQEKSHNKDWVPMAIGIGCGCAFGILIVIFLVIYWNKKSSRRRYDSIEQMHIITAIGLSNTSLNLELREDNTVCDDDNRY